MDTLKSIMEKIEENKLPPTLRQGLRFKKYQKEITTNPRAVAIANDLEEKDTTIQGFNDSLNEENEESSFIEGFENQSSSMSSTIMTPSAPVSQQVLSQLSELDKLQTQYNSLIEQYKTANTAMLEDVKSTIQNITNNPYANKNVKLKDGKTYYVTSRGVSKLYDSTKAYSDTSGQNGCPSGFTSLDSNSLPNTTPGSNMVNGQSCGHEATNVFVDKTLNAPSSTYVGCYKDSSSSPAMTSLNNGSKLYSYSTCQEAAVNSGSSYFGLQGLDTTTNLSSCYISNNLSDAKKYGQATTVCNSDSAGNIYGNTLVNAIYESPSGGATTYVGTYGDNPSRAMPLVNGGSRTFTYETCKQQALQTNSKYFGLQYFNSGNQRAQCTLSNDSTEALKYGKRYNETRGKDGKMYGGGWSNSIYQVESDLTNYKGCYNDKEGSPTMTPVGDGSSTYSFSTCKDAAKTSGNKYFALQGTSAGSSKCFVSNDLSTAMKYGKATPCSNSSTDDKQYGNNSINAIYRMSETGDISSVGKIGYVDNNSNLTEYPDSMIDLGITFNQYNNYGTTLSKIDSLSNATYDKAVSKCVGNSSCYGFTIDTSTNLAQFYGKDIIKPSSRILKSNSNLYIRELSIKNLSSTCNKKVENIDSNQWKNYVKKSGYMSPSSPCDVSKAIVNASTKSNSVQSQIIQVSKQIISILNNLNKQTETVNSKTGLNTNTIQANIQKYNDVIVQMSEFTDIRENNIGNIVKESDIKVLQENYGYMFWTILAIATVIITMNVMRK
jgi:type II secretory pathway pseudopilin PulG